MKMIWKRNHMKLSLDKREFYIWMKRFLIAYDKKII